MEKEEFYIGQKVIFNVIDVNSSDYRFNQFELEIVGEPELYNNEFRIITKITKNFNRLYPIGKSLFPPISSLIPVIPPKPHEYSPIQMTGRYKTIGD